VTTWREVMGWPVARLGEALEALASHAGLAPRDVEVPPVGTDVLDAVTRNGSFEADAWIEQAAAWLGVEAEAVDAPWTDVAAMLAAAAPAIVWLPSSEGAPACLMLLVSTVKRASVGVLGPDLVVRSASLDALRAAMCDRLEAPLREGTRALLTAAKVSPRRFARAEAALTRQRLGGQRVYGCWLLRADPGEVLVRQLRHAGAHRRLGRMLAVQLGLYAVSGVGWYILGRGALEGTLDRAWLVGWALALLTTIPLQLLATWHGGFLALEAGSIFKRRLLAGAARLDPEVVRHQGAGGLLGRVIESSAVEQSALSGATLSIAAVPSVGLALAALAAGPGGALHALAYAVWVALGVVMTVRYAIVRRAWTRARVAMTNDLVERMVGHRTRIAQESPARWHDGEDKAVERYVASSERLDRAQTALQVIVPRGWTLVGIALLAPALTTASATAATLALGVGAVVLAGVALRSVTTGLVSLLSAGIAWREVAPLFDAAGRRDVPGAPLFALRTHDGATDGASPRAVIEAADVVYRHEGRSEPVLRGVSLRVNAGDRILLEGPSGGGKSTLGAVLSGLRVPSAGLLLLHGLDARSVGYEAWRRRVVTAPQFHENHILTGTMAFNLLLGRRWPATDADLAEAETVCRELELGPLLDRMPSGLQQMVGESGWRLSHGEQSRVFMARALLQGADVVVLDESFAALDPATLQKALACAFRRCPSLLVIAHP
jgi:ATP-binding cassette, subfamily B, bacterial